MWRKLVCTGGWYYKYHLAYGGMYSADEMAVADRLQVDVVVHSESQVDWLAELDSLEITSVVES